MYDQEKTTEEMLREEFKGKEIKSFQREEVEALLFRPMS